MNNKQKLHQIKLTQWAALFQVQAASGLSVKAWCAEKMSPFTPTTIGSIN